MVARTTPRSGSPTDPSDAFVFFGATGDLAFKQIFPALAGLVHDEGWTMPIIGIARHGDLASLRERARQSLEAQGLVDRAALRQLQKQLRFIAGSDDDPDTFRRLRAELGAAAHPLHYLAIPPALFGKVIRLLGESGCADGARVIVEKPFGRDLAGARRLNDTLHRVFDEADIFRIDHFLGKEAVQNLIYFRFANRFLEPIWNADHVASVQITMAEAFDVADRGAFYDEVGRDPRCAPEPPAPDGEHRGHGAARRSHGRSPCATRSSRSWTRSGRSGRSGRRTSCAASTRATGTSPASRRTPRWRRTPRCGCGWTPGAGRGVPFIVRTGKCLPVTATEVLVELRRPPVDLFDEVAPSDANYLRFRLSPDMSISLGARAKKPGERMVGEDVELYASHQSGTERPPYQRLIGDAAMW